MTMTITISLGEWKQPFLQEVVKLGFSNEQEVIYFLLQYLRADLYVRPESEWMERIITMRQQIWKFEEV